MSETLAEFNQLTDAEQYFKFFNLIYDPTIVNVNRLHILQQFSNSIKTIPADLQGASEAEILSHYRAALQQAYDLFTTSNSLEQKLFKVFHDKPQNVVLLSDINAD
jgi:nitrogenase-stabilizing/protective protein